MPRSYWGSRPAGLRQRVVQATVRGLRMRRAPQNERIVEHVAIAFLRVAQALEEVGVVFGPPASPLTGVFAWPLVGDIVRRAP